MTVVEGVSVDWNMLGNFEPKNGADSDRCKPPNSLELNSTCPAGLRLDQSQ